MKIERVNHALEVTQSDLSKSSFNDVNLSSATFENVDMSGWSVNDANMAGLRVDSANLSGMKVSHANLAGASLDNCRLDGLTIDGIAVTDLLVAYHAQSRGGCPPDDLRIVEIETGLMPVSTRQDLLARLRHLEPEIRRFHVSEMFVFGSAARDELDNASDIDIFIDYEDDGLFSFRELIRLPDFLEPKLGRPVDLATRGGLHPALKSRIEHTAVKVF